MSSHQPLTHKILSLGVASAVLMLAASCTSDHLARQEGVTSEVGNANGTNMVQMATNTMPQSAQRTSHSTDGARMAKVLDNYRNPQPPTASEPTEGDASTADANPKQQ